jgi:hypothetical protein
MNGIPTHQPPPRCVGFLFKAGLAFVASLGHYTRNMRSPFLATFAVFCFIGLAPRPGSAQSAVPAAEISADLGPCSAHITVTGTNAKPVYAAKITARVLYGPFSIKKLDLEAFTGADGQVTITHLPEIRKKTMTIYIRNDDDEVAVDLTPSSSCHSSFSVQLQTH